MGREEEGKQQEREIQRGACRSRDLCERDEGGGMGAKKKRNEETGKRTFPCSEERADLNVSSFLCVLGIMAQLKSPAGRCEILPP